MATSSFSITAMSGFPPATSDDFPDYLQWQSEGVDLGAPTPDTINVTGLAVATRGTGENANVVTVNVDGSAIQSNLQWQADGVNLGSTPATTINVTGNASTTRVVDTITIDVGATAFTWRDVPGDYTLVLADSEKGLSTSGTSGVQNIHIPSDGEVAFADGAAVIVYQEGAAQFAITSSSGVAVRVNALFNAASNGQYATVTLIKRRTNEWIVCGDLEVV